MGFLAKSCVAVLAASSVACGPARRHRAPHPLPMTVANGSENLDFFAPDAQEYYARGTATVTLEASYATASTADRLERARTLASLKRLSVGWFLNTFVEDKEDEDPNVGYGNFNGQVRFGTEDHSDVTLVSGLTYSFPFQFDVGGSLDFLALIAAKQSFVKDGNTFLLPVGKVPNADLAKLKTGDEWFRLDPWQFFKPSAVPAEQLEYLTVTLTGEPLSHDAYLPLDRLITEDRVPVAIHFGWDGDGKRYDIPLAKELYEGLLAKGFKSRASSFESYVPDAYGPLTQVILINSKPVTLEVSIYHGGDPAQQVAGPDPDTDLGAKALVRGMLHNFATAKVIVYIGHSGTLYGYSLSNWNKTESGDISLDTMASMPMLPTFQLVIAEGCQTYSMADAFWKNPAKSDQKQLNLVTSLGFTDADSINTVTQLLASLLAHQDGRAVTPRISAMLRSYEPSKDSGFSPLYGMNGVDADPQGDPLADPSVLCRACKDNSDCGLADGNVCAALPTGQQVCTMHCLNDSGCPSGYACTLKGSNGLDPAGQCVPTSNACPITPPHR